MGFENIPLNDGTSIVPIAFGTGTALYGQDATSYVLQALDGGFTHIDTAQIYKNEESVGAAIAKGSINRDNLYITTKYGGGDLRPAFETSLRKLGLDAVDLYLIHTPGLISGKVESSWRAMEKIKEEGLAKSIGISNFNISDLRTLLKIAKIKPAVNQVRFHPYNWAENKDLLEFSNKHGIVLESYSGLTPITKSPGGPLDPVLKKIAKRLNATPAQVIFSWIKAKGVVIVTTTSKKDRIQEYLDVAELAPLTPEEISEIEAVGLKGSA